MIKTGMVLLAVLAFALLAAGCGGDLPDDGVAKVGDNVITREVLDTRVKEIQTQLKDQVPTKESDAARFAEFEKQVLDYLVTLEVVQQKADELKVSVTDEDVNKQIEQIKQMFQGDQAKFDEALKQQNLTLDGLKKNLREQELIKKVIETVTKDIKATDEEIKAKYEENKASYKVEETRKTRHILISPGALSEDPSGNASDAEWQAAKEEADKVLKELQGGGDFAALAKQYSDDPGSKPNGGDLGNVSKGTMVPEFDEATFSLEKGKLSEPVKTQFGYHIIQVQEINPAKTQTLEEVKEQIRAELEDVQKREVWEKWLADTKGELNVIVKDDLKLTTTTTGPAGETGTTAATEGAAVPPQDEGATETTAASTTTSAQ